MDIHKTKKEQSSFIKFLCKGPTGRLRDGRKPIPPNNDRFSLCKGTRGAKGMELYEVKVNPEIWMIPKKKSH